MKKALSIKDMQGINEYNDIRQQNNSRKYNQVETLIMEHMKIAKQWKNANITNDMINYAYELTMEKFKEINFKATPHNRI